MTGTILQKVLLLGALTVATEWSSATPQTMNLNDLPPSTGNTRFFSDDYPIKHPSLSLNGFDCSATCSYGLGLKQVLETVYNDNDELIEDVFVDILSLALEGYNLAPSNYDEIWVNTIRLQARAFIALASYVLEENGYPPDSLTPALPDPLSALGDLKTALLDTDSWILNGAFEKDAVKWATPITNVARALDLYLALENAYKEYDLSTYNNAYSTTLLSQEQKDDLLSDYSLLLDRAEWYGGEIRERFGVDAYDVQPGNWPLKVQLAIGYGIMTRQDSNNDPCQYHDVCDFSGWLSRAFQAAGRYSSSDRHRYWRYQSSDGKYFWAEGPYYLHLSLSQVIPFWHAARINGLLWNQSITGFYIGGDPFFQLWFSKPLQWLADLATPDGKTPPIDDGNKQTMYNTSLLRWTSAYGAAGVGQKFAWISDVASRPSLMPVEIAIPRQSTPASSPLPPVVGNTSAAQTGINGRQEVVFRREAGGREHYVLVNGESSRSVERGEGHEQGDQLQLLYYVDDYSYLVDSGYDSPDDDGFVWIPPHVAWYSSSWNHYYDHNATTLTPHPAQGYSADGGIKPPEWITLELRVVSDHQPVNVLYRESSGKLDIVHAHSTLNAWGLAGNYVPFADYFRTVLLIQDPQRPYLVDINAASGLGGTPLNLYHTLYHGNSNSISELWDGGRYAVRWNGTYESESSLNPNLNSNNDLFLQPFAIERPLRTTILDDTVREPYVAGIARGAGVAVKKLRINGTTDTGAAIPDFTSVAFIRALPDGQSTPQHVSAL